MPAAFPARPGSDQAARPEDDAPLAAEAAGSRQRPPGPADGNPLILRLSVSLLISAALLFWLLGSRQAAAAWDAVRLPAPGVLGLLVLLQCLSYGCRAARLSTQFATRLALGWRSTLRMTLLHNLGINVIPFRAGELLLPAMLHRAGLPLSEALATLLWLRIQDVVVLAGLTIALWPGLPLALRCAALLGLAAAWPLARHLARTADANQRSGFPFRHLQRLRPMFDGSRASWLWTVANWLSKLSGLSLALAALAGLPVATAVPGVLGGELSAILPVQGIAGFGTYEAGVALPLAGFGLPWQPLLAAALSLHLITIAIALVAGTLAWVALPAPELPPSARA